MTRSAYKSDTQTFVQRANDVHNGKYSYEHTVYVNQRTKVIITCHIHGDFEQTPKNHLNGQGCPECGKIYAREYRKKGYERFVAESKKRFNDNYEYPHIEDEYENSHSKITLRCKRCGSEFVKIACDHLTSPFGGCKCRVSNMVNYDTVKAIATGNEIKPFDGFLSVTNDKVIAICPIHGEYEINLSSVIKNSYSCKRCVSTIAGKKCSKSTEHLQNKVNESFGKQISINKETYINMSNPVSFHCNTCGIDFTRIPTHGFFKKETPCPKCSKEKYIKSRTKDTAEFIQQVINVHGEGKFDLSETVYTKSSEKVTLRCLDCGRTFHIEANSLLQGHGCPYHNNNSSSKEKEIAEFIRSLGETIFNNDRIILNGYELDVYVPNKNMAFEFDGVFWHNENCKSNDYHLNKTIECQNKGIRLIHIFEDEWRDKRPIWESMICNLLGKTKRHIYARQCIVKEISWKECNEFVERNHLQGKCPSSIHLGLFTKDTEEIVAVMSFGKSRHFIGNGKIQYELLRFCNKLNTNVIGGASKLWKYFIKIYNPTSVISYADKRWSNGNLYEKLGFVHARTSRPNYYYVIKDRRYNRFNFRKSILMKKYGCPQELSEREFCKMQKWYRIYDCGCLCYEYKNNVNV